LHFFIAHDSDNVNIYNAGNKTIGVFIKPEYNQLDDDINNIPTHLGKTQFTYWRDKLPTIILGEVAMYYHDDYKNWVCSLDTEVIRPCLIGNTIVSFEIEEFSSLNRLHLKLDTL
jgi:hypothetical protein